MAMKRSEARREEIRCFAKDLYDYIWTKQGFSLDYIVKIYNDKLNFENVKPQKPNCYFHEDIGKAVEISQCLLREFCRFFFDSIGKDLTQSHSFFNMCLNVFIPVWLDRRRNVFHKVIDTAAMITEAILYCKTNIDSTWPVSLGPAIYSLFFESRLKQEFFTKGGWAELKRRSFDDYVQFYFILAPFIREGSASYQDITFDCDMIRTLKSAAVMFPVKVSRICNQCTDPSSTLHEFICYPDTFYGWKSLLKSDELLSEEAFNKLMDSQGDDCPGPTYESPVYFHCYFLGESLKQVKKPGKKNKPNFTKLR